jgi:hypothetical protein
MAKHKYQKIIQAGYNGIKTSPVQMMTGTKQCSTGKELRRWVIKVSPWSWTMK